LPAAIESSARRNLRKAEEAGILVRETPDALPVLETMHRANMQAIGGRQKPPQFFRSVADVLEFGRDWTLYTAELHGRTVGALLLFQGGRTIEYIMPAIDDAARQLQPTALMIARAMRDAIERGFRRWNWGGTWLTQDGVYRFKRKWGARERRYSYFITIRDERLLACSPDELSAAYPYFYTAPYRLLAEHA
jgi:lipid II:glycine glycyltransferase (peptidoglycan interpeptide bridge formation enzyme)